MRFQLTAASIYGIYPQVDLDQLVLDPQKAAFSMAVLILSRRYLNNHNWVEYWDNVQQTWSGLQDRVQIQVPRVTGCFGWKFWAT